tara:strand:- start:586 stop:918 length:333 start_codon:yes stop_codon:yes gene_type:complete
MRDNFLQKLTDINYANLDQKNKELWDVEGILKNRLNQKFKFDLRPIKNNIKIGSFKTKADKMVFNMKDEWIIVDVEELHSYVKTKNLKDIRLEDLISKLEWNIILPKNKK